MKGKKAVPVQDASGRAAGGINGTETKETRPDASHPALFNEAYTAATMEISTRTASRAMEA